MGNRILLIILFPITVFLWLAGWTLFWTGSQLEQNQPATKEEEMQLAEPMLKEEI